jgi:hypothetical protein
VVDAHRQIAHDAHDRRRLEVVVTDLPTGLRALHARAEDGFRCILISRALPPVERLAALAHELAHDDRRGGCHQPGLPDRLRPIVTRDEARVDRIAADRVLPLPGLASWVDRHLADDSPVTPASAAEELEVAPWVAELQLRRLEEALRSRLAG